MPKIPRIGPSLNTLSNQSPNAFQRDSGATADVVSNIGGAAKDTGEMFKRANLLVEQTKAQNDLESKLSDIRTRAASDPDNTPKKRQQYDEEINKATSDSAQHITIPEERGLFTLDAENKANVSKAHVDGIFHQKTIDQGKADLDIYLNNKKDEFIKAQNPKEKEAAMLDRDKKIDDMVKAGFLEPADATTLREKQTKDWAKSQVEYDIATNPDMAKALLKDKQYPDITEEERVDLLTNARAAIRKNTKDAEDDIELAQISNEADYLTKFANGETNWMNLADIAGDVRQGILPEKFGSAMADVIKAQGEYEPQQKENENYPEFINQIYQAKDKKELQSALLGLLKDHKNISQEKMSVLINGAMQRGQTLGLRATQPDPKQQAIDSGAMSIVASGVSFGLEGAETGDIYHDYMKSVSGGSSPKEALDGAMRTFNIKKNPWILSLPAEGKVLTDTQGNKATMFPDGSYKEVSGAKPSTPSTPAKK